MHRIPTLKTPIRIRSEHPVRSIRSPDLVSRCTHSCYTHLHSIARAAIRIWIFIKLGSLTDLSSWIRINIARVPLTMLRISNIFRRSSPISRKLPNYPQIVNSGNSKRDRRNATDNYAKHSGAWFILNEFDFFFSFY